MRRGCPAEIGQSSRDSRSDASHARGYERGRVSRLSTHGGGCGQVSGLAQFGLEAPTPHDHPTAAGLLGGLVCLALRASGAWPPRRQPRGPIMSLLIVKRWAIIPITVFVHSKLSAGAHWQITCSCSPTESKHCRGGHCDGQRKTRTTRRSGQQNRAFHPTQGS